MKLPEWDGWIRFDSDCVVNGQPVKAGTSWGPFAKDRNPLQPISPITPAYVVHPAQLQECLRIAIEEDRANRSESGERIAELERELAEAKAAFNAIAKEGLKRADEADVLRSADVDILREALRRARSHISNRGAFHSQQDTLKMIDEALSAPQSASTATWIEAEKAKEAAYEDAARICEEMSYPPEGRERWPNKEEEWAAIKLEDAAKSIRERKAKKCHVTSAVADSRDAPEHVCGLQGYNPAIDPQCPGCAASKRSTPSTRSAK